jgi:DNA repair exonuclease SbcCD ATPase subunit
MIVFKKLFIENFMSYQKVSHEFCLDDSLVLIEGEVRGNDKVKSNGAGKSALFEAIVWLFYDQTIRGIKKDEVINDSIGKGCLVQLIGDKDGKEFILKRYRKHPKLKTGVSLVYGSKEIQPRSTSEANSFVENFIGLDFQTFSSSLVFTNRSTRFSQLTPAGRTDLFNTMLELDKYSKARELVKSRLSKKILNIEKNKRSLQVLESTIEDDKLTLESYIKKENEYYYILENEVKALRESLKEAEEQRSTKKNIDEAKKIRNSFKDEKEKEIKLLKEKFLTIDDRRAIIEKEFFKIKDLKYRIKLKTTEIDNFSPNKKCPTCGQGVEVECYADKKKVLESNLNDLKEELNKFDEVSLTDDYTKIGEESKTFVSTLDSLQSNLSDKLSIFDKMIVELEKLDENIAFLRKDIELKTSLPENNNPYREIVIDSKEKIALKEKEIASIKFLIKNQTKVYESMEFWERSLSHKGIKTFIINSLVPYMNNRAEEYSEIFTDSTYQVNFTSTKELKGGDVRDEIGVCITSLNGGNSYDKCSDGEKKRIDLIIQFVLDDVRTLRSNGSFNIRFYDELFDSLDSTGITTVLEALKKTNKGKTIYLISHNDNLSSKVSKTLKIIKEKGVSTIYE